MFKKVICLLCNRWFQRTAFNVCYIVVSLTFAMAQLPKFVYCISSLLVFVPFVSVSILHYLTVFWAGGKLV